MVQAPPLPATAARGVTLAEIAGLFTRISLTAFGASALVLMRQELTVRKKWLTEREFMEIYALAQVCPGGMPISIAVLCGKRLAGTPGFFVALVAETVPGFTVLMCLALLSFDPHMTLLRSGLRGAAAAALGSMVANALQMSYPYRKKIADLALIVAVALAVTRFQLSLWTVFLVFLPISIALVRMLGEI